jgi:hypothetical protein
MIQPLRKIDRRVFVALAVALPAVFVAGLAARRLLPPAERVSDRISLIMPSGAEMVVDARELWGGAVDAPDPLVYCSADGKGVDKLLGSLHAARHGGLRVPEGARYLMLYSLAWRKPLAVASVPKEMP